VTPEIEKCTCEKHPYNDVQSIPTNTTLLIVGTAPNRHIHPRDVKYFYGSRKNQLWSKIFPSLYRIRFIPDDDDLTCHEVTAHTFPSPSNATNLAVNLERKIEMYRNVLCP
jgi:hypothetical protein